LRDKHRHIAEDSQLLKLIHKRVREHRLLDKKKVKQIIGFKFLAYCLLTGISYAALFYINHIALFLLCFIVFGLVSVLFIFNFAHDFSHNTVFKKKKWNQLGFFTLFTMVGAHAEGWKQRHVSAHHYAPNVEGYDSDLEISGLIRMTPTGKEKWYHRFQHWYAPLAYTIYSLYWIFVKDILILFTKDQNESKKGVGYHLTFWVQKLTYLSYLVLLPLLFSQQSWAVVLLGFLLMHVVLSLFLLFTFLMTHHVEGVAYPKVDNSGYINESWLMNQVKSSNDFHPFSPLANFIFGGFNNHIAHHLFPNIHHVHYPKLNTILYQVLNEHNISPNQTTYLGGIKSHLRHLKKLSKIGHNTIETPNIAIFKSNTL
jgi:linoleoyl-CoA desaturase